MASCHAAAAARLAACPDAAALVSALAGGGSPPPRQRSAQTAAAATAAHALFALDAQGPSNPTTLHLARCPGRLDVLGGVTDIFGGLSLQAITAEEAVLVLAQAVRDGGDGGGGGRGTLRLVSLLPVGGGADGGGGAVTTLTAEVSLALLAGPSLEAVRAALEAAEVPAWARYVAGAVAASAAAHPGGPGAALPPGSGLRLLATSTIPPGAGLASSAALCTAVAAAVGAALAGAGGPAPLPPAGRRALVACAPALAWAAETRVAGAPCGPADQAAVWWGVGGALLPIDCGRTGGKAGEAGGREGLEEGDSDRREPGSAAALPVAVGAPLPLPPGWVVVAVESGIKHSVGGHEGEGGGGGGGGGGRRGGGDSGGEGRYLSPYAAARAAGLMAAALLPRAPTAGSGSDGATPSHLPPRHFMCEWGRAGSTGAAGAAAAIARLPASLAGREWDGPDSSGDGAPSTGALAAAHPYPVRAAASHAVWDAARSWDVRRALAALAAGGGAPSGGSPTTTPAAAAAGLVGVAMAASHAGYTAIGLSHPATDAVATCLGAAPGVAGARVSGGGAGGAVVALLTVDGPPARAALAAASAAAAAPWGGGAMHWAAGAGALGGAGFGVVDVVLGGGPPPAADDWGGLSYT